LTVRRPIPSSSAICLLSLPATTRSKTSRSRRREERKSRAAALRLFARCAFRRIPRQRALQRIEQRIALDGFLQEVHRPRLHRSHTRRHIGVTGKEDDGQRNALPQQRRLKVEPRGTGHAHVEQHATRPVGQRVQQELARRRIAAGLETRRVEQFDERRAQDSSSSTTCISGFMFLSGAVKRSFLRKPAIRHGTRLPVRGILGPDPPAVGLYDRARDRQAKPHAFLLGTEERIEELSQVLGRDAMTAIAHRDGDVAHNHLDRHHDCAPVLRKIGDRIHRVEHQVDQHLLDLCLVTEDDGRRCRGAESRVSLPAPRFGAQESRDIGHRRIEVEHVALGLVPRKQRAQPADHVAGTHVVAPDARDDAQEIVAPVATGLQYQVGRIGAGLHRTERLVDLVRDRRRQLACHRQPRHMREFGPLLLQPPVRPRGDAVAREGATQSVPPGTG